MAIDPNTRQAEIYSQGKISDIQHIIVLEVLEEFHGNCCTGRSITIRAKQTTR